jgi:hypothetical protein
MAATDNDADQPEEAITQEEIHGEAPPAKKPKNSSHNACLFHFLSSHLFTHVRVAKE